MNHRSSKRLLRPSRIALSSGLLVAGCALWAVACQRKVEEKPTPTATASAPATVPQASPSDAVPPLMRNAAFPVLPGRGVGPVRLGATLATIERLMGQPCGQKDDGACRYLQYGLEFRLENGVTTSIVMHPLDTPANVTDMYGKSTWSHFRGMAPGRVSLGLVPDAVIEGLGKPLQQQPIEPPSAEGYVLTMQYDGLVIDFSRNPKDQRLFASRMTVVKGSAAATASATGTSTATAAATKTGKAR